LSNLSPSILLVLSIVLPLINLMRSVVALVHFAAKVAGRRSILGAHKYLQFVLGSFKWSSIHHEATLKVCGLASAGTRELPVPLGGS